VDAGPDILIALEWRANR